MANALSDEAWAEICAAAGNAHASGAEARALLSTILFEEYPAFAYDRKRVAADCRRAERMLKHLDVFAELYRQRWFPDLADDQFRIVITRPASVLTADVKTEAHFSYIRQLRQRAEALWLGSHALRRAHRGRRSVQREMLYHRLATVWLDHFNALELTYSVPSRGGHPHGPLIAFMFAAMRQVMSELPSPETVRDGIDRERRERENAKQLRFEFERRQKRMGD